MSTAIAIDPTTGQLVQTFAFQEREDLLPTTCQRCGRSLRAKSSRDIGYGPTCAKRLGIDCTRQSAETQAPESQVVQ